MRVLQARAQLGVAIGDLYPQTAGAFGSVTYNRQSARAPFQPGGSSSLLTYWQAQVGVQAAWELDFWGRFRRAIEAADAALLGFGRRLRRRPGLADRRCRHHLRADPHAGSSGSSSPTATSSVQRESAEHRRDALPRRHYQRARRRAGRHRSGLDRGDDSADRAVAAADARTRCACSWACRRRRSTRFSLAARGIPTAPMQVAVGIPADLLRRRPDVRSAELRAAAQSAQIGVAKADLYPAFSLTGNFGFLSSDWSRYDLSDIFTGEEPGLLGRAVGAVEHPQLRPDHQQCPRPGCALPGARCQLPEHRAERAAGSRGRPGGLRARRSSGPSCWR